MLAPGSGSRGEERLTAEVVTVQVGEDDGPDLARVEPWARIA
jgi:hypothetical protein